MNKVSKEQLELELLSGCSVTAGKFKVKSYSLREIVQIGYDNYYQRLGFILFRDKKGNNIFEISKKAGDKELRFLMEQLTFFIDGDYHFLVRNREVFYGKVDEDGLFIKDTVQIFKEEDFNEIKNVLMLQHNLKEEEEEDTSKMSEGYKKMLRLKKEAEEKERKKRGKTEKQNLSDIISAVASKANNINIINVWDLTVYQFYNVYRRTMLVDHYHLQQLALVNGAKIKEMINWTDKI